MWWGSRSSQSCIVLRLDVLIVLLILLDIMGKENLFALSVKCYQSILFIFSQCVVYVCYTFSNFVAPGILHSIGIRKTLIVATLCFLVYTGSFLYIHNFIYFPAAALGGFAFSCWFQKFIPNDLFTVVLVYYVGAGTYSAKHSTDATFSRNQAIYWTVAQFW